MPETDKIPPLKWEENKDYIRALYLDENKNLNELIRLMEIKHGFFATRAQYIRKLSNWKMKKNATKAVWKHAERMIEKRKVNGKDTEIVIHGRIISEKRLKKERGRYGYIQTYGSPVTSPQHSPSEITAMTPPGTSQATILTDTTPFFGFQSSFRLLVDSATALSPSNQPARASLNAQLVSETDVSLLAGFLPCENGRTKEIKTLLQLISVMQAQVPSNSCPITGLRSSNYGPLVHIVEWAVYRCTNNLLDSVETYSLLYYVSILTSEHTGLDNLFQELSYMSGPTTRLALSKILVGATTRGHSREARMLLQLGADPRSKQDTHPYMSVLQMAAKFHDKDLVNALLQKKVDPNKHDLPVMEFIFPLTLALMEPGAVDVVKLLVDARADVNYGHKQKTSGGLVLATGAYDDRSIYPLELAVCNGELEYAEELVKAGARVKDPRILTSAIKRKDHEMISALCTAGADPNGWIRDRALIEWGADVNAYSAVAGYPLQMATGEARDLLLQAGADAGQLSYSSKATTERDKLTKLQMAAGSGDVEQVRLLISSGENVNEPAYHDGGMTALQYASIMGHFNMVHLLLENRANINADGALRNGRTALEGAAEHGRLDIVHLLLENDNQPELLPPRCSVAAALAEAQGHHFIARDLRRRRSELLDLK